MIYVNPDDIVVPEGRFRQVFNEKRLTDLENSIRETGLIHPITVERGAPEDKFYLRAGERRLRVLKKLVGEGVQIRTGVDTAPGGTVPAIEWDVLSAAERVRIEVEENIDRDDFNFAERARALEAYHKYRQTVNPSQTVQQTATEVKEKQGGPAGATAQGSQVTEVAESLLIAKHLDDPDVAGAKDRKEAVKIIKRKAEAQHRAKLAAHFDLSKTEHKLIRGSAKDVLPTLPANSYDVILTDPPYGVGADNFGDQFSTGHDYKDSPKYLEEILSYFCDESFRVAKERAHCYVFCDVRKFDRISVLMVLAGWKVFPTPLIWYKHGGALPLPKLGPRRTYECILYAYKGDRETIVVKNDCIVRVPAVKALRHGAQKPVALYCDLLSRSAQPGDTVLDCFGGSGPILVAANRLKLTATYVEELEEPYNFALTRVHTREIDDGAEEDDGIRIDIS